MGDLLLFFALLVPALATPLALLIARDKLLQRSWSRSASQLDLRFVPGPLMGGDQMEGTINGHRVLITSELRRTTRVLLDASSIIPFDVQLSLKSWGFIRADESLSTGDDDFDRTIFASGPHSEILARLTAEARAIVREAITGPPGRFTAQIEISNGWIVYTAPGVVLKIRNLTCILFTLVRLAEALRLALPTQIALHDNAVSAFEEPGVRLKNLRALLDSFPSSDHAVDACRSAMRARSWSLRLTGAEHLDHTREGINTLLAIMRSDEAPSRARMRALRHLIGLPGRLPPDEDVVGLSRAHSPELRIAAVEVLGMRRTDMAIDRLLEMIGDPRFEVVQRVASNLAGLPGPRTERALIALLAHDTIEVRRAAARALESAGTVQAVEPLLETSRGVLTDLELKTLARRAVSRIQARLIGADTGHLSLSAEDDGSLSFAIGDGALSLED